MTSKSAPFVFTFGSGWERRTPEANLNTNKERRTETCEPSQYTPGISLHRTFAM
jgi:hypothetical protein